MLATSPLASAVAVDDYSDQSDIAISTESCRQFVLIKKIKFPNFGQIICPDQSESNPEQTPETKPDETPEQTPDAEPDETPDQTPEQTPAVKPEEILDNTPDTIPDQQPDSSLSDYVAEVVRLVNAERAKKRTALPN